MCGEQFLPDLPCKSQIGSPPRVRGTGFRLVISPMAFRITPACAGNSKLFYALNRQILDHPRVCGEQHTLATTAGGAGGSPPRVRGTVNGLYQSYYRMRITPACAGNSFCVSFRRHADLDHPRVCGEQFNLV